jgi:hypothetical protein
MNENNTNEKKERRIHVDPHSPLYGNDKKLKNNYCLLYWWPAATAKERRGEIKTHDKSWRRDMCIMKL